MVERRLLFRGSGRLSRVGAGVAIAASALLLVACGGSSGPNSEEIARLKRQGAEHVHKEERLRKLEKELKHIKKGPQPAASVPQRTEPDRSSPTPAPVPTPSSGLESCGGELEVNSYTTCPFAEDVENDYFEEIGSGSGSIEAYSPVTEIFYVMYCTSSPHECTGGKNAAVYFP